MLRVTKFATLDIEKFGPLSAGHHFNFGKFRAGNRKGIGLLRLFDDGLISAGARIPEHPHKNVDIVSIVLPANLHPLTGKLEGGSPVLHADDNGFTDSIAPLEAQLMSAGSGGVRHSEMAADDARSANVFQIWLLQTRRSTNSHYGTKRLDRAKNQWGVVASGMPEDRAPVLKSPSRILSLFLEPHKTAEYQCRLGYVSPASGAIEVNGERLEAHDAAAVTGDISIKAVGDVESLVVLVDTVNT